MSLSAEWSVTQEQVARTPEMPEHVEAPAVTVY